MRAMDFEYDGLRLSDFGYILCNFDGGGMDTVELGAPVSLNTVPMANGVKQEIVSASYDDTLTFTFQICRNVCNGHDDIDITVDDIRELSRWLNRKEYHKFRIISDDYSGIYFMSTFNISKICMDGMVCGLELEMVTDSPFAYHDRYIKRIRNDEAGVVRTFFAKGDEYGSFYPDVEIKVRQDGDLDIENVDTHKVTSIRNCKSGEVITMRYPMIWSDVESHNVAADFNWIFFCVSNTFKDSVNKLKASLPCDITISYCPIVKVGI